MSGITSHVLDTSRGVPAANIEVQLEIRQGKEWKLIGKGVTNKDGRLPEPLANELEGGHYRIIFLVADYFASLKKPSFFPRVRIEFLVDDPMEHYHVPLLLSPFGYSTYRGS